MLVVGISGLIAVAGGLMIGTEGIGAGTGPAVGESTSELIGLRAHQEVLRGRAFALAERSIEVVEQARRAARSSGASDRDWRSQSSPLPARDAGNEALLDWLSEQQALLATVEKEMVALRGDPLQGAD